MTTYGELNADLIGRLEEIVGTTDNNRCLTGDAIGEDYTHDEMPIYGSHAPAAVCLPASTEEVWGDHGAVQRARHPRDRARRGHRAGGRLRAASRRRGAVHDAHGQDP